MRALRTEAAARAVVNRLEKGIPALMARTSVPGLALCLARVGEIYCERTYGVRSCVSREPVMVDTVFEAASLSKPVFAYVVLQLCAEGVLDLDTPLDTYLDDHYAPDDLRSRQITTRHVLCHATGFPNWCNTGQTLRTHFSPGQRFSYSGEGYVYLQKVVEHVTGQPAAELLKSRVLRPCRMQHSSFQWTGKENLAAALGHNKDGEAQEKTLWPSVNVAASLHTTAGDYARYVCELMRSWARDAGGLGSGLTETMLRSQIHVNDSAPWGDGWPDLEAATDEQVSWGLGWGLQRTAAGDYFWHWGDNGNYRDFVLGSAQDGHAVVVMTNGENGQEVINWVMMDVFGGDHPALAWLARQYR